MSIIRGQRPESNWYALDKRISEDDRLSWAARGLLVFLLGKPDHWRVSVEHLRAQTAKARITTGRDGIYALLAELQAAGYVETIRNRANDGTLGRVDYLVHEIPAASQDVQPRPAEPEVVKTPGLDPLPAEPYPAEPDLAEPTLVKTERAVRIEDQQTVQPAPAAPASRFAEFWEAWPVKVGKKPAEAKWQSKKLDRIADQLIADVRNRIANDDGWKRGFVPNPTTYLNQERWNDALRKPTAQPVANRAEPPRSYKTAEETAAERMQRAPRRVAAPEVAQSALALAQDLIRGRA